jgi:hypothetical protein
VLLFAPAAEAADLHACKLSPDRRSVTVTVSNPYAQETHCQVNCHITIPGPGVASISCGRTVPANAKDFVLCTRTRDNNAQYVKLSDDGNSECVKPLAQEDEGSDDDDDATIKKLQEQGQKILEQMKKR